jgi:hypothetical protein
MYFLVVISCSILRGMVLKEPSSIRIPEAIEGAPMSPKLLLRTKALIRKGSYEVLAYLD